MTEPALRRDHASNCLRIRQPEQSTSTSFANVHALHTVKPHSQDRHEGVCLQLGVTGILVLEARQGGPAWKAGIQGTKRDNYGRLVYGDIITKFNGASVK